MISSENNIVLSVNELVRWGRDSCRQSRVDEKDHRGGFVDKHLLYPFLIPSTRVIVVEVVDSGNVNVDSF